MSGRSFTYNLRFPGQIFDGQAGLHQNGFRDFDPAVGRYVQSDPIGLNGGINTFAYTHSNPVRHRDPLGLDIWVEGPSGNEPEFHQSINVGDPFGTYTSMSYGAGLDCFGCVYFDEEKGGEIEHYIKTTPEEDLRALEDLLDSMSEDSKKWYGPNTCRTYSQDKFNKYLSQFKLKEQTPPPRLPNPRSPWRQFLAPTLMPSSSSSSSNTSSSR